MLLSAVASTKLWYILPQLPSVGRPFDCSRENDSRRMEGQAPGRVDFPIIVTSVIW